MARGLFLAAPKRDSASTPSRVARMQVFALIASLPPLLAFLHCAVIAAGCHFQSRALFFPFHHNPLFSTGLHIEGIATLMRRVGANPAENGPIFWLNRTAPQQFQHLVALPFFSLINSTFWMGLALVWNYTGNLPPCSPSLFSVPNLP